MSPKKRRSMSAEVRRNISGEGGRLGKADPAEASNISPDDDDKERLRNAYGGIEIRDEFHVLVEKDGRTWAVPSGGGIRPHPTIDWVHVVFKDGVESLNYVAPLKVNGIDAPTSDGETVERIHRFRTTGTSAFAEPWAVEVALSEENGWLIPKELRFEGLAKPIDLGRVFDERIEREEGANTLLKMR